MRDRVYTIVYMIVITAVATGLMTGTKVALQDRIELNEQLLEHREQLRGLGLLGASEEADAKTVDDLFRVRVVAETRQGRQLFYAYEDEGQKILTAIGLEFEEDGLWGPVRGLISFTPDSNRVRALTIINHTETPGLGGRITELEFSGKFSEREIPEPDDDGAIHLWQLTDAITGATRTSESMERMLNQAVQDYLELAKQESEVSR